MAGLPQDIHAEVPGEEESKVKTKKKASDKEWELILNEMLMHDLLDDLKAPRYPNNDKSRPAYGIYGRLKAYAESIGVKASIWEPKS
jgi:hypothetical protein